MITEKLIKNNSTPQQKITKIMVTNLFPHKACKNPVLNKHTQCFTFYRFCVNYGITIICKSKRISHPPLGDYSVN